MAKPRIFISSTFYDLKQIRTDLDNFIKGMGYDVVRNEQGNIPYGLNNNLEEYCYKEISSVDNTYLKNKENNIVYSHADDVRIYKFLEEIHGLKRNNVIQPFSSSSDIINFLKEQWAGLFQHYLQEQANIAETDMLKQLNDSLMTVRDLTQYLVNANENQNKNLSDVLIYTHPVFNELRKVMGWKFPIIFYSIDDLTNLLRPWSYVCMEPSDKDGYIKYSNDNYSYNLYVLSSLFNSDGKLLSPTVSPTVSMVLKEKVENDLPF